MLGYIYIYIMVRVYWVVVVIVPSTHIIIIPVLYLNCLSDGCKVQLYDTRELASLLLLVMYVVYAYKDKFLYLVHFICPCMIQLNFISIAHNVI